MFPEDYKEFVATYGDGEADAFLTFLVPEQAEGADPSGAMAEETAEARRMWLRKPPAGYGSQATPTVIAWGVNARADLLCCANSGGPRRTSVDDGPRRSAGWPTVPHPSDRPHKDEATASKLATPPA